MLLSGNWGCGAFGGNKTQKFLQQILAASESGRQLDYHTFDDAAIAKTIEKESKKMIDSGMTVGQVYKTLKK